MSELSTPPTGVLPPEIIGLTPNVWTAPFWDAAAEHRLVVPRCRTCGTYRNRPNEPVCFIDLDGVHDGRPRRRRTSVLGYSHEEPVAQARIVVPVSRHSQTCNVTFMDGHAKAIKISSVWIRPGEDFNTYWLGTRQAFNPQR